MGEAVTPADETDMRVMRKFVRESTPSHAAQAVYRAIKAIARRHGYRDGFVEWRLVESIVENDDGDLDLGDK